MDPYLIILHLIENKLKLLTNSAITYIKETLDKVDLDSQMIQEAEIISSKLQTLLNRLDLEMTNYFRMSQDTAPDDLSEICTVQLEAQDTLCELNIKLKNKSKIMLRNKDEDTQIISGKLPKLDLPIFEGNILEWHSFWDQFNCNIHNRRLSDVDKLLYLKASLRGEAKKEIEGLDTTEKNYQLAVQSLKERYGKPSQVVDAHYRALYKIEKANKTTSDCRRALNEVERHLRVLDSLGEDINHNHLRFLVLEKFPHDVIYEMKMKMKEETIQEMRTHLATIVTAREDSNLTQESDNTKPNDYTVETLYTTQQPYKTESRQETDRRERAHIQERYTRDYERNKYNNKMNDSGTQRKFSRNGNQINRRSNTADEGLAQKRRRLSCIFCEGQHYNDECERFKTISERKSLLKDRCYICFQRGHSLKQCDRARICVHCKNRSHNRSLCPERLR